MTRHRTLSQVMTVTIIGIVAPAAALAQQPPQPAERPIDAAQVLSAIEHGVGFLKQQQLPRGNWPEFPGYDGGVTGLCTLALLDSGVGPNDPTVRQALAYLRGLELDKTYTVSLQTMVLCAAEPKRDMLLIRRNAQWLEAHQIKDGPRKGAWSYPGPGGDNSNSQFAVLALYDAQRVGVEIDRHTWEMAAKYWRDTQNDDGSWGYVPGDAGTGSMTCAGIGGLAVSSAALESGDAAIENGKVACCRPHVEDDRLDRAIDWLGQRFSVNHNPRPAGGGQSCLYYYLYGLERAGRLTAHRFIGKHDWYREGAEFLVREQDSLSHYWKGTWYAEGGTNGPRISTAMALLFLSKGRRPVVMAKLKYGDGDAWEQHRRDAAHLTEYTEEAWGLGLTWQVMDPTTATVEDLLQSPVLYISGSQATNLLPQAKKLRDYVDRGGFIFAEACCGDSSQFDAAFRQLMNAVFPEAEYKLQPLPPGHPIWRMQDVVRPESPYVGKLLGVDYGCRTCVVYCTEDLSCYWELAQAGQWNRDPPDVAQHIADALAIGVNVLTYATNREPKGKEESFNTPLDDNAVTGKPSRDVIEIAKLRHGGGCNDAPGALLNLLRTASQGDLKLQVRAAPELINISDPSLFRYHMVFMHGRQDFHLTDAERSRLRQYLERGGTLLADAICASKPFAAAFRREIGAAMQGHPLQRIPSADPLFTNAYGGYDIRHVSLRDPLATDGDTQPVTTRVRQVEPQLDGINIDGRWAVVFSPFDISCALESHQGIGCRGYTQQDAARIGLNVLLYSLNQ
ncbi:MAG TPA: DUF4159 domain-containing protein [Lacipirellulaceae bacterium]|nr:DUF4159 domain-containing protein [Lacipirellulaceae bacterium]